MFGIVICLALVGDISATDQPNRVVTRDDVEVLARQYRIQVYNSYRTQRSTFDERTQVANEVLELARRVQSNADSQLLLAGWFEQARAATGDKGTPPAIPHVNENEFENFAGNRSSTSIRSESPSDAVRAVGKELDIVGTTTQQTAIEANVTPPPVAEVEQSGGLLKAIGSLFSTDDGNESDDEISNEINNNTDDESSAQAETAELDFE